MVEPRDQGSAGFGERLVPAPARAVARTEANHADALGIAPLVILEQLRRSVGRAVVDEDVLHRLVRLREHALDRGGDERLPLEGRRQDAHERAWHVAMVAVACDGDDPGMPLFARRFARVAWRRRARDVLFLSGPGDDGGRYRCDHQAEQLRLQGWAADVRYYGGKLDLDRLAERYRTIVLYRVPWDARITKVVGRARQTGTAILADVDDLVFDPARVDLLRWLDDADAERLAQERETMSRLRQTLERSDGVLVSTDALARHVTSVNSRVAVTYNTVSAAMAKAGAAAMASSARDGGDVVLAYLSGTATHDRDFLEAAPSVLWALERFEEVRFWAAGLLTLDERFERFGSRVLRLPYRPARRLPRLLASVDVSLAPLEPASDFTDAKSCLKYLEAAVVGVPTVASATSDFRRAIESGVNGFLAADDAEWRAAVEELVASAQRRREVGLAAREDVLAQHTTAARAPSLAATLEALSGRERAT